MFCQYCGKQLPDNARFCDSCGGAVNTEQLPKTVWKDMPQQPQTPPETSPTYTIPLDPDARQVPPQNYQQQPYSATGQPQYTPPVNSGYSYVPPVIHTSQQVPPVYTQSPPQPTMPVQKQKRKLPILLGALAVVLVIVLVAVFAGGGEDEVPGALRFDETGFLFTHEEMIQLYGDVLEEEGIALTIDPNYKAVNPYVLVYDLLYDGAVSANIEVTLDPGSGKIIRLFFDKHNDSKMPEKEIAEASELFVDTCHGGMTSKKWKEIDKLDNAQFTYVDLVDGDLYLTWINLDGLMIRTAGVHRVLDIPGFDLSESTYASYETAAAPQTSGRRFADGEFLFTHEELLDYLRAEFPESGVTYTVESKIFNNDSGTTSSYLSDASGSWRVMYICEYNANRNINLVRISVLSPTTISEEELENAILACHASIITCHGDLSEEEWNIIDEATPTTETDTFTQYRMTVDGMDIEISIGETYFFIECAA